MKLKKVLAGILSAAMVLGTMVVPAAAAEEQTSLPYVANYGDTAFTTTYTQGDEPNTLRFEVQGASEDYAVSHPWDTEDEAMEIEWKLMKTVPGVRISNSDVREVSYTTGSGNSVKGYIAYANVTIDYTEPGLVVLEAVNPDYPAGAMDLTLLVNAKETSGAANVTGIQTQFYDDRNGGEGTLIGSLDSASVSLSDYSNGPAQYTNAMCAVKTWGGEMAAGPMEGTVDTIPEGKFLGVASSFIQGGDSPYLRSVTFKFQKEGGALDLLSLTNGSGYTAPGWLYRVYTLKDGVYTLDPISEDVGAAVYQLHDDDIIVWKFGTYTGTEFPDTISKLSAPQE